MHDERVGLAERQPRLVQTEQAGGFAETREYGFALTLVLDAQQVD